MINLRNAMAISKSKGHMIQQDKVVDLFAFGIVDFRKLFCVANTLQEGRFTCIWPAEDQDSEVTNAIEMLFDFRRIHPDSVW